MKRGIAAEDSEGEKWWHQRGEDWRCLWRFHLWGQKEVTENAKKNHVLHSIVFIARIPPLLWRREKVLSKLYWLVLSLEVGDFKASSMRKLILTPLTISRHRGSDFTRGMNIPYCSEALSYQTQSWGRFYLVSPSPSLITYYQLFFTYFSLSKTSLSLVFSNSDLVLRPAPTPYWAVWFTYNESKQNSSSQVSDSSPGPPQTAHLVRQICPQWWRPRWWQG